MANNYGDDLRDVTLEAQAEITEIVREITMEFVMPQIKRQARQMWMSMPDEMKEVFKAQKPEAYAEMMNEIDENKSERFTTGRRQYPTNGGTNGNQTNTP